MAQYELFLCGARGRRLMPLNNLRAFTAAKTVNAPAPFSAMLRPPADLAGLQNYHYIERNIRPDWQVQVWRKDRGPLRLWNTYFVLNWGWSQSEDGEEVFAFGGYDPNHLLTRRIVAAYDGSAYALWIDEADDVMKAAVEQSLGDIAPPVPTAGTRAWDDLTVAPWLSKGPVVTIAMPWQPLLTLSGGGVLPQIARASREEGNEVFWRVKWHRVGVSGVTYQFRTYTGQPLGDRTSGRGQVLFDADRGTLVNWSLDYDYSEEVNYVYGLGEGDEDDLNVQQVYDEVRYKRSYWGRCEGTAEARNQEADDGVIAIANSVLGEGRPRVKLRGEPVSTPGQAFGRHYGVGDRVLARAKGRQHELIVWSAVVGMTEDGSQFETVRLGREQ